MIVLLALVSFAAVATLAYGVFQISAERRAVRASLLAIDGEVITRLRERQLLESLRVRVASPLMRWIGDIGGRVTPKGYVDSTRRKLAVMGKSSPANLERFLAIRALTVFGSVAFVVAARPVFHVHSRNMWLAVLIVVLALILGPDAVMNRRAAARQMRIRRQLPDLLDLLTISVEAGLGFEQALDRTVRGMEGELSEEMLRMLGEMRAGSSRADAMRSLQARVDTPEIRSFVVAILQADTFGVSIGKVLRNQAREMRVKRRQLAEETAQKVPVKMLFPMVFCIFPAMFVVVLGPAIINIAHSAGHGVL